MNPRGVPGAGRSRSSGRQPWSTLPPRSQRCAFDSAVRRWTASSLAFEVTHRRQNHTAMLPFRCGEHITHNSAPVSPSITTKRTPALAVTSPGARGAGLLRTSGRGADDDCSRHPRHIHAGGPLRPDCQLDRIHLSRSGCSPMVDITMRVYEQAQSLMHGQAALDLTICLPAHVKHVDVAQQLQPCDSLDSCPVSAVSLPRRDPVTKSAEIFL